jgi:hypothetical protein
VENVRNDNVLNYTRKLSCVENFPDLRNCSNYYFRGVTLVKFLFIWIIEPPDDIVVSKTAPLSLEEVVSLRHYDA